MGFLAILEGVWFGRSPNFPRFPGIFLEQCKISYEIDGFRASLGGELVWAIPKFPRDS